MGRLPMLNVRSLVAGCVVGAVIAAGVGVAYAAIPDGSGVVHACFQNVTSANKPVKLLDTAKSATCPSGWKAVSWNQKGQAGQPGAAGVSGYVTAAASASGSQNSTNLPAEADCPTGTVPLGGGYTASFGHYATAQNGPVYVRDGSNNVTGGGWAVNLYSTDVNFFFTSSFVLNVYVDCAVAH
jgi:hypothetical protein